MRESLLFNGDPDVPQSASLYTLGAGTSRVLLVDRSTARFAWFDARAGASQEVRADSQEVRAAVSLARLREQARLSEQSGKALRVAVPVLAADCLANSQAIYGLLSPINRGTGAKLVRIRLSGSTQVLGYLAPPNSEASLLTIHSSICTHDNGLFAASAGGDIAFYEDLTIDTTDPGTGAEAG